MAGLDHDLSNSIQISIKSNQWVGCFGCIKDGGKVFLMYIYDEWNEFVKVNLSKEAHDEILQMKAGV